MLLLVSSLSSVWLYRLPLAQVFKLQACLGLPLVNVAVLLVIGWPSEARTMHRARLSGVLELNRHSAYVCASLCFYLSIASPIERTGSSVP